MTQETIEPEESFKDYYEILHLHAEADAAMVDQAYWHLARLYNAAIPDEPDARTKLDNLNEAYSVLRDAGFRASYDKVRGELVRTGRLPDPDESEGDEPPLAVMAKQKPKARKKSKKEPKERKPLRLPSLPWQSVAALVLFAGLAGGALALGLPLAFVGGLLIAGLVLGLALLVVRKLPGLPSLPATDIKLPGLRAPRLPERSTDRDAVSPDSLYESTVAMRERWRNETHDATSGLPENTIWPKDIPPPGMSKAGPDDEAKATKPKAKKPTALADVSRVARPAREAEGSQSDSDDPKAGPVRDAEAPIVSEPAPASESFKDAVGELRRRGRADAPQETATTAPQSSKEPEPQVQPASVLRDKEDASTEKPGPFSVASGSHEPPSEAKAPTASESASGSESFKDAVGELRRRGRADAPQEATAQPTGEAKKPQVQPALVLHEQDESSAEKPGPSSTVSGSPDLASEAEPPASDDDAPEPPPMDEKLADSLGALRRRWRAGAPKDLSTAFPQNTVWAKLEAPEKDPAGDEDSDAHPAPDPE